MSTIISVLRYTIKQHFRTKVYLIVVFFGFLIVAGSVVVSSIAAQQRMRMLMDLGLGAIEFLALLTVVFATVNLVIEEIESRNIFLILSHPVKRWQYLLGRYSGTVAAVGLGMLFMAVTHLGSLYLFGWRWENFYLLAFILSFIKIMVISAVALALSLFSTSAPASMVFTLFIWVVGHFSNELKYLAEKSSSVLAKGLITLFYYAAPNLEYFNYRDYHNAAVLPSGFWFLELFGYSAAYITVCFIISNYLFSQKEF